jgi:Tol biopolymer transport system component
MKRCPQCNRVESDEALKFCRVDGATLIDDSSRIDEGGATQTNASEIHTSILPRRTDANVNRQTAATNVLPAQTASPTSRDLRKPSGRYIFIVAIIALIIGLAGVAFVLRQFVFPSRTNLAHFQTMKIARVTNEGNVDSVAISPDGKYIAYSLEESGKRSLWTKHLATDSRVQIVAPVESLAMNASTFSPDGGYVYYTRIDEQNPKGAVYQVPVLGGTSKKILSSVSQPVSISPDGKLIAFGRYHVTTPEDELLVANADGSNERLLLRVEEPNYLSGSNTAWSPDGKTLAVGYGSKARDPKRPPNSYAMTIALVSLANPGIKSLAQRDWPYVGNVAWLSDGSGLVFIANEHLMHHPQVWQASYPSGETRRVTNDLNAYDYDSLTLTADAQTFIAVQTENVSNIWTAPDGDSARARAITSVRNVNEGTYGLSWTPDGKVIYDSDVKGNASIWVVNADGTEPRAVTDGATDDYQSQVSPDGRYIVFGSTRNGTYQLWRMDIDGRNSRQLTHGVGAPAFSFSPDGQWVIYYPWTGGTYQLAIDGGDPVQLITSADARNPQISPDGKLLAYFFDDEQTKRPKIAVIEVDGGRPVTTLELPVSAETSFVEYGHYHGFLWAPDGRALVYVNTLGGISNLWRQPLDGKPAKQITNFKSDLIYSFAYAHNGRDLALARGSHTRDAVLISEEK